MMKRSVVAMLLASACWISGCATAQQSYLDKHPELSAEHRKIIAAGRLADHDPVAGMTKEQIRLTMGVDPSQLTSINGENAWVWVKKGTGSFSSLGETDRAGEHGSGSFSKMKPDRETASVEKPPVRTTVFFQGNIATHVDVSEEAR